MVGAHTSVEHGWVDAKTGRVVLPRAGQRIEAAPEGALPVQIVEGAAGRFGLVRGPLLDVADVAVIRHALRRAGVESAFVVGSERDAFAVDAGTDVARAAEALAGIVAAREPELAEVTVFAGPSAACADASGARETVVVRRERDALEAAYRAARGSVALLRADIDRFMVFNDWAGFVAGDLLLARLIGMARAITRESNDGATLSLARRDVLVLVPGLDAPGGEALAAKLVERMREARAQLRHREAQNVPYMTLSVGVAAIADPVTQPLDDALAAVDRALLAAKQAGRDRVACLSG